MIIKFLDWDSTFFNRKIGMLNWSESFQFEESMVDYDLIYVSGDSDFNIEIPGFKEYYSENKIVFSKKILAQKVSKDRNIFSDLYSSPNNEIYDLALESGKFSRFNRDIRFKKEEFQELYKKWIDNSYNKKIADEVLVYKIQNERIGFVTYKVFSDYAKVGLIAISPNYQGKGIGRKMIEAVENNLISIGIHELQIPTQYINEQACSFYKKMGYQITENKILKHFWKL